MGVAVAVPRSKYELVDADLERVSHTKPWPEKPAPPEAAAPAEAVAQPGPSLAERVASIFKSPWTAESLAALTDAELRAALVSVGGKTTVVVPSTRKVIERAVLSKQAQSPSWQDRLSNAFSWITGGAGGEGAAEGKARPPFVRKQQDEWDGSKSKLVEMHTGPATRIRGSFHTSIARTPPPSPHPPSRHDPLDHNPLGVCRDGTL